jgi:hypothetical protein
MHLIQILLPLADNEGAAFPDDLFAAVQRELTERFGGVTAFTRAPAEGVWRHAGTRLHDDIVIVEVMAEALDRDWWRAFRLSLEKTFRQERLVIRSQATEML